MATYNPPAMDAGLGIPSQASDTIGAVPQPLLLSDAPDAVTFSEVVAASQTLAAFTVVGKDSSGRLVKATWNATEASRIKPIGILTEAITTDSSTNYKGALVYKSGHFNFARLVWDSSFLNDADKMTQVRLLEPHVKVSKISTYTP